MARVATAVGRVFKWTVLQHQTLAVRLGDLRRRILFRVGMTRRVALVGPPFPIESHTDTTDVAAAAVNAHRMHSGPVDPDNGGPEHDHDDDREHHRYGRRVFLGVAAAGLSSLAWGNAAWNSVSSVVSPIARAVLPFVPGSGWRIYMVGAQMPAFDPATWTLSIGGLVAKPLVLTYDELRRLPRLNRSRPFTA